MEHEKHIARWGSGANIIKKRTLFMGIRKLSSKPGAWLALALLISFMPLRISAFTVGEAVVYEGTTYVVSSIDDSYNYVTCIGSTVSGALTIPETFTSGDVTCKVTKVAYQSIDESQGRSCHFYNVTSLTLPNSVTDFATIISTNKLTKVHIPSSCTNIEAPFDNTTWIPIIELESGNPNYELDSNGILYNNNGKVNTSTVKSLTAVPSSVKFENGVFNIPSGVKKIERAAIVGNSSLVTLNLPESLNNIDNSRWPGAIAHCTNFTTVTGDVDVDNGGEFYFDDGLLIGSDGELMIYPQGRTAENYKLPNVVRTIENYAFFTPTHLKTIDLNKVETINGVPAFYTCTGLTSVTIGKDVETIANGAFEQCTALENYTVDTDNQYYKSVSGVLFTKSGKTLVAYPAQRDAGEDEEYSIPDGTEVVGRNAFMGAQRLEIVNVPTSLKSINFGAFRYVPYLEEVNFEEPSNVTSIDTWAFRDCDRLSSITLPSSLTELRANVFQNSDGLWTINVPDGSKLETIDESALANLKALENFNFEGSCALKSIGTNAFANCLKLESIALPSSVTTISRNAFQGCSSLAEVTFGDNPSITKIGAGAFSNCGLESISIPSSVVTIEAEAFNNCSALTKVDLSAKTTSVDPRAFMGCSELTTFTVDAANTKYSAVKGYLLSKDKTTLVIFPAGKANDNVTLLPPSLTAIGDYAFYHCDNLTNVVIPQKVSKIGNRAFGMCDSLNYVTFLCDEMIEPGENLPIAENNIVAFDNGENREDGYNALKNITISVREDLYDTYKNANEFYKQFHDIETSFTAENRDSRNIQDEYMPVSSKSVMLLRANNASDKPTNIKTYVVCKDVKSQSGRKTVDRGPVSMISDYAFENSSVEEVVVPNTVMYVGAMAFVTNVTRTTTNGTEQVKPNGSSIKDVVFCGDMLTDFQLATQDYELSSNYNEFTSSQKIYVRKSQLSEYQAAMPAFESQITYKIPASAISNTYGSFAREFDTDFSEFFTENPKASKHVAAFRAMSAYLNDANDKTYAIRMKSIDETGGKTGDYGYIPANTGVLLKVLNGSTTENNYWYTIGEEQGKYSLTSSGAQMYGVTIADRQVGTDVYESRYVLNNGKFHPIKSTITIPVHKAYLEVDIDDDEEAKVVLVFDDGETTDISSISDISNADAAEGKIYNMNGQRVAKPTHGVYLKNGKKYIVK